MSRRSAIALALTATVALAFYGHEWVALPKQKFAGAGQADKNRPFLSGNNAWCITRQLQSGQPSRVGRIHVAWTQYNLVEGDSVASVYTRYTDDYGVTWSEPYELSCQKQMTDSARDIAIASIGDTIVVAFFDDYTEGTDGGPVKRKRIIARVNYEAGDPDAWVDVDEINNMGAGNSDHFDSRHPSLAVTFDHWTGGQTRRNRLFDNLERTLI
jgi:hypothetical protein